MRLVAITGKISQLIAIQPELCTLDDEISPFVGCAQACSWTTCDAPMPCDRSFTVYFSHVHRVLC